MLAETFGEIWSGGKTNHVCDLVDTPVGRKNKVTGLLETIVSQNFYRSEISERLYLSCKLSRTYRHLVGERISVE